MKELYRLVPHIEGVKIRLFQVPIELIRSDDAHLFYEHFFSEKVYVLMNQIHGEEVYTLKKEEPGLHIVQKVDGIIAGHSGIVLSVLTGDCLALTFFDPKNKVIAACHAGYKGVLSKIIKKTVIDMMGDYGTDPSFLNIYISPAIGKCCYNIVESNDGRIEQFKSGYPSSILSKEDGGLFLDLKKAALYDLKNGGILERNVHISNLCTACTESDLPSHYRSTYLGSQERVDTLITTIELNA